MVHHMTTWIESLIRYPQYLVCLLQVMSSWPIGTLWCRYIWRRLHCATCQGSGSGSHVLRIVLLMWPPSDSYAQHNGGPDGEGPCNTFLTSWINQGIVTIRPLSSRKRDQPLFQSFVKYWVTAPTRQILVPVVPTAISVPWPIWSYLDCFKWNWTVRGTFRSSTAASPRARCVISFHTACEARCSSPSLKNLFLKMPKLQQHRGWFCQDS